LISDDSATNIEIRENEGSETDMTKILIKLAGMSGNLVYEKLDEKRINIEKYT